MKKIEKEEGMLIVEATLVFPIVFLVIFLMIFLGNAYFQKSRFEHIIISQAYNAAEECANPMLREINTNGTIPGLSFDTKPYRYFGFNHSSVESECKNVVESRIKKISTGLFSNMQPKNTKVECKYQNKFISSSFCVYAYTEIELPIKLIGMDDNFSMKLSSIADIPLCDVPEFIRDVDLINDYLERYTNIEEFKGKVDEMLGKVDQWIN